MLAEKINLEKTDKAYYKASKEPQLVELDAHYYLTIQGKSHPDSDLFMQAIETLYGVAYAIKFLTKAEDQDFTVPKMEGYWWVDGGLENQHKFLEVPKDDWNWMIVIRMPDFVEEAHFFRAVAQVREKKNPTYLEDLKFQLLNEGRCAQILHVGSYDEETPTIMRLLDYIKAQGLKTRGYHHEIYLSDPRRTAPEKRKTILRYEVG
jgi:hypothetical protein